MGKGIGAEEKKRINRKVFLCALKGRVAGEKTLL